MAYSYCTINDVKAKLNIVDSSRDDEVLSAIQWASAYIDGPDPGANRTFTTRSGVVTLEWDGLDAGRMWIGDVLSITTLKEDTVGDGTWTTTWTAGTDYALLPEIMYPKVSIVPVGTKVFAAGARRYQINGVFGYGNGSLASPWNAAGVNASVNSTDGTTVTLSSACAAIKIGHTIKVQDEQMTVLAIPTTTTLTVERAQQGTTGAIHSAKPAYVALYPVCVTQTAIWLACEFLNTAAFAGIASEQIKNFRRTYVSSKPETIRRLLNGVRRG